MARAPPSGRLLRVRVPPLSSAILREMLSPNPVPLPVSFVVKNGEKSLSCASGGIPVPESSTWIYTTSSPV